MVKGDTTTFHLFVLACELRSVTRAADMMNIAVSAASRRLANLEAGLQTPLLQRRSHGVEPTAEGLTVYKYARDVLRLGDELELALREYRSGVRGRIRISASSSALVRRLAADLASFGRENPDIAIDLEERPSRATVEALLLKDADIGVVVADTLHKGLEAFPYTTDRLAVALPGTHRLAGAATLSVQDLLEEEFIALDSTTAVHRALTTFVRRSGHELKVRVHVRSFETMCQMISHGLGIGIMPDHAIEPLAEALSLRVVRLEAPFAERLHVVLIRAGEVLPVSCARLLEHLGVGAR